MYKWIISIIFLCSCTTQFYMDLASEDVEEKKFKKTENHIASDLSFPLKETAIIDHYRSINPTPILVQDNLLYTTKNGRFFSYSLATKKLLVKESYSYGTNLSPIVLKSYLVLFSSVGKESVQVFTLKGEEVWKKDIPYGIESQPVVDGEHIYVAAANGMVYSLSLEAGAVRWEKQMRKPVHAPLNMYHDLLLIADDKGHLSALSKSSGTEIWSINSGKGASYTKPVVLGNTVLFTTINGYIAQINVMSGHIIWERTLSSPIYSTPSSDGIHIYLGSNDGNLYKLDFDGKVVWKSQTHSNINSQVLVGNQYVYFGTSQGNFFIIDKHTRDIKWQRKFKGRFISSPLFWNGSLIVFSDNDDVLLLEEDRETVASQ